MKTILTMILIYCLAITSVFGQATNPSDTLKIGKGSTANDKGLIFDTNDGVSNKKLTVEKVSKKLKWDGNSVQIGDGSAGSDKTISINGASKSLKYNGTSGEFEFDDTLKLSTDLKTNTINPASGTETSIEQDARVKGKLNIGTGTNELRVSGGNLEFSNDGALYKKIGSGSGSGGSSGISIITNDSFEDGLTPGWTSSGGTFSQQTYTNGVEGDLKYARFVASTSGQYVETTAVAIPTSFSGGCQADFKKVNVATAGLFKIQAMDTTGATVYAEQTIGVSSWIKVPTISFPCPVAGTMVKLRLISLAAGTIDFDRGYIGSNQNLVHSSQAKLLGSAVVTGCANSWIVTSTSFTLPPVQAGCSYALTGSASAPSTNIPGISFAYMPAGEYRIEYEGFWGSSSSGAQTVCAQFSDGSNTARETSCTVSGGGASTVQIPGISQTFSYATAQSNVTISARIRTSTASAIIHGTTTNPGTFKVYYSPFSSDVAVSNEQSSWFIDANIGGANPATTNIVSYTPFENASLDLVLNSGSASAEIPCSLTNASTGLTCSVGNEQVGVAFIPPYAGTFEACLYAGYATSGAVSASTQWVETANNSQTILQEGKTRIFSDSAGAASGSPLTNCGIFSFNDTSKRTLRFSYEANSTVLALYADRSATYGQRDIHIIVRPILSAFNRPVLTGGQVTTPGGKKNIHTKARVSASGVVTYLGSDTPWISSNQCTISSTSLFSCNYVGSVFDGVNIPICHTSANSSAGTGTELRNETVNSLTVETFVTSSGAAAARGFNISCYGISPN